MKHFYSLLFALICMLTSFQLNANEVIVKGVVKNANGTRAANIQVKISVEAPCVVEHYVTTNSDGYFTDKVSCDGKILAVRASTKCDNQVITQLREVSLNFVVEFNLTLCSSTQLVCVARFTASQVVPIENQKFPVKFNSSGSETTIDDQIIHRSWNFGDGSVMNEGTVGPSHNYEKPGIYNVCLTIKTAKGCSVTKCMAVEVKARCHAEFQYLQTSAGVKFNSTISSGATNDPIVGRSWNFGDGSPIVKDITDPLHAFPHAGTYNVCLVIRTTSGCENKICKQVVVPERTQCRADFQFAHTIAGVKFNSNISTGASNDPIVGRSWNFGDGSPIVKGNIDPVHSFPHPGTYNVCLVVWTAGGCENKICKQVIIQERIPECRARFSFERVAPNKFRFNSSLSVVAPGDEIVERQWDFRDGTGIVKTRDISVLHEFARPGIYEVCLKIKTAKGCESRFCLAVKVEENPNHPGEASVKIISLYPLPVHHELKVLVYSRVNQIPATISIVDIYGQVKWSRQVWLVQGYNPFEIPTASLLPGPYFFRIVTSFGVQSRLIYKI